MRELKKKIEGLSEEKTGLFAGVRNKFRRWRLGRAYAERDKMIESFKGKTLRQMVGVSGTSDEDSRAAQMRFMGSGLHTIQDTFAKSHAFRPEASEEQTRVPLYGMDITDENEVMRGVNPIRRNADFVQQDTEKHHTADELAGVGGEHKVGLFNKNLNNIDRTEATAGARQAGRISQYILYKAQQGSDNNNLDSFFDRLLDPDSSIAPNTVRSDVLLNNLRTAPGDVGAQKKVISRAFQVPGSIRANRKVDLDAMYDSQTAEGGKDDSIANELAYYKSQLGSVERGEGSELSPNRIRNGQERSAELFAQFQALQRAIDTSDQKPVGDPGKLGDDLKHELLNDCYEIYSSLESLSNGVDTGIDVKAIHDYMLGHATKSLRSSVGRMQRRVG
jgi:hypothetical protein